MDTDDSSNLNEYNDFNPCDRVNRVGFSTMVSTLLFASSTVYPYTESWQITSIVWACILVWLATDKCFRFALGNEKPFLISMLIVLFGGIVMPILFVQFRVDSEGLHWGRYMIYTCNFYLVIFMFFIRRGW